MTDIRSTLIPTPLPDGFRSRLRRTAGVAATAGAGLTLIWALTGGGMFWPIWAWLGLAAVVTADAVFQLARHRLAGRPRPIAVVTSVAVVLLPAEIAVWAFTGGGYFWPVWSALLLGGAAVAARVLTAPVPARG
jgi:hypothetical protein